MGSVAFDDLKWAVGSVGIANDCSRVPVSCVWGRGGDGVGDCLVLLTTFPFGKRTCFYTPDSDTAKFPFSFSPLSITWTTFSHLSGLIMPQ